MGVTKRRTADPAAVSVLAVPGHHDFTEFYRRELPGQIRRAALILDSDDLAHDVVHDAFLGVFRQWGTLENPGGYLNRSVLNGCRDVGRRRVTQRRLAAWLVGSAAGAAEPDPLGDVLRGLPFNQRAAVVLRYYGDLTIAEIAESMDCPQGSIGPWLERGLASMRKVLT